MAPAALVDDSGWMNQRRGSVLQPQPKALIGTWRRFGVTGPVYEIVDIGRRSSDDDCLMRVRVVETGEELDYRVTDILEDPREG